VVAQLVKTATKAASGRRRDILLIVPSRTA
jgi:hypothetical protein